MKRNTSMIHATLLLFLGSGIANTIQAFDPGPQFQMKRISESMEQIKKLSDDALKNLEEASKKISEARQKLEDTRLSLDYEMKRKN